MNSIFKIIIIKYSIKFIGSNTSAHLQRIKHLKFLMVDKDLIGGFGDIDDEAARAYIRKIKDIYI